MSNPTRGIFSEEIAQDIALRLIADSGEEGMSEEDITSIINWIEEVFVNHDLVQLFMEGKILIEWKNGEPFFWSKRTE